MGEIKRSFKFCNAYLKKGRPDAAECHSEKLIFPFFCYIYKVDRIVMYKYTEVSEGKYVLSLDNHVEIMAALNAFCKELDIYAGSVSGLGAVSEATFRFLDPATKQYVDKTFSEQMEITNLTGNISIKDGEPYLHVHVTAGRRDYSCIGGHLLQARINGACELVVEDFRDGWLGRRFDPETGLNLYEFKK